MVYSKLKLRPKTLAARNLSIQQNEPNGNYSDPEKVHSVPETLLPLSNIRAHLMSLGEDIEAFDSLKKLDEYLSKKT